jgi:hypothetical protein
MVFKKVVQQGRSEWRPAAYLPGYVDGLNNPRTLLADFFSILLDLDRNHALHDDSSCHHQKTPEHQHIPSNRVRDQRRHIVRIHHVEGTSDKDRKEK